MDNRCKDEKNRLFLNVCKLYTHDRYVSRGKKQQEGALSVEHGEDEVKAHTTGERG